jgi:peroxiredoxin
LQESLEEIHRLGAALIAVSPELFSISLDLFDEHEFDFDILSDTQGRLTENPGLNISVSGELRSVYRSFDIDLLA